MIYIMFNKPRGYITAKSDANRKTVMEFFPSEIADGIHPVGRLDIDTEGLLVFTDDGFLDNELLQPNRNVEKEYYFEAVGEISEENAAKIRRGGIYIYGESEEPTKPALLEDLRLGKIIDFAEHIPDGKKKKYMKNPCGKVTSGKIRITEGRKHEVKLIIGSAFCTVFYLKRLSLNGLALDEKLRPGEWRFLTAEEIAVLKGKK